jgi:glycosyltransferase involved in cell wall biosynthesis
MRIAMVSEHASPLAVLGGVDAGGQNVHVAALAMAMARRGHAVTVFTRRDDPALPTRVAMAPRVVVEHVDAGPPRPIPKDDLLPHMDEFARCLLLAWTRSRPDLVHAHFWMSGKAALEAARPLEIPVVQTFHALGVVKRRHQGARDTSPPQRLRIECSIIERADHIVATCTDEVFELLRLHADRRRISVVPCGVDLARFRPYGPAEPRERPLHRLVVVSRLVERKGIGDVIQALASIPDAELVVAGGPSRDRLAEDAEGRRLMTVACEAGVADRVDFRGAVDRHDVPGLIRSADLVVCVPWYEPFGIVPVEAMACGVPVVGSAVGGLIDTVVDGVTGVHVPPRDPVRLAAAIRCLLDDPARRASLGSAGARRARERYGHDQVAALTLDCYRQILGGEVAGTASAVT